MNRPLPLRSISTAMPTSRLWQTLLAQPVMMCGLRPFFLLTAISALVCIPPWLLFYTGQAQVAQWLALMPGGPIVWHAHELVFGFGMAAVAGFLLVAVPEFTQSAPMGRHALAWLCLCWLAARLVWLAAPALPLALSVGLMALTQAAFFALLLALVTPRLFSTAGRLHLAFLYALLALASLQAGFLWALCTEGEALRWLNAAVGALMALTIVAASRISMRIVNSRIVAGVLHPPLPGAAVYLARPPRRNFAIFTIVLCSALEFFGAPKGVTGWCALAAAAAVLGLLNDWHIGRPLFNRWALGLYVCYWMLALGYALMGLTWLQAPWAPLTPTAGRHLLTIGTMGLSILVVMCIAGRQHCGHWLDQRVWVPLAALALLLSALLRAWAGMPAGAEHFVHWLMASGLAWCLAFALYLWHMGAILFGPRQDGLQGCQEPANAHELGSGCG